MDLFIKREGALEWLFISSEVKRNKKAISFEMAFLYILFENDD